MLVLLIPLLIFTGSADALTAAPMMPTMPTQTSPSDLDPTAGGEGSADASTAAPMPPMMANFTPDMAGGQEADPGEDTAGVSPNKVCSYHALLTHLNMRKDNKLFTATRPVLNYTTPTEVWLDVALNAILNMADKEQQLTSYLDIEMSWLNEHISWEPAKFCGIRDVSVPSDWLWKPDIFIDERLQKDKAGLNPYVRVYAYGMVTVSNNEVVVSTCKMSIYKFPFDTQSCKLTFASGIYRSKDLKLLAILDSNDTRFWTDMMMRAEYEWKLENIIATELNETDYIPQRIIYTITMKRKAVLYIVNFLLPVLFFLGLDMASFLISDRSGEKLSFKVTVLLAVTVLQLILNDILPATSNRMPIIAMYCMGTFSLMLLSLLETVLVTYLMEKDSQKKETDKDLEKEDKTKGRSCDREKRCKWCPPCFYNVPDDDDDDDDDNDNTDTTHQSVAEKDSDLKGESHGFQVILDELRDLEKNLDVLFKSNKEDGDRPGYWTRMATRINNAFFMFYVATVIVFLGIIFNEWSPEY